MLEVHSHLIDVLHPSVLLPSIKVPVNISMHDRDRNVLSFSNCQDLVFLSLRYFDTLFSGFVSSTIIDRTKDRLVIETDLLSSSSCRIASSASDLAKDMAKTDYPTKKIYEKDHIQMKRRKGSQSVMLFCGGHRGRIKAK